MASPLECWSSRTTATITATTDDDTVEQVLMGSHHRSEATTITTPSFSSSTKDSSMVEKKLQSKFHSLHQLRTMIPCLSDVFLHIKLIEQASETEHHTILFQEETDNDGEVEGYLLKLAFAMKKPRSSALKLPFGLCGCQEENFGGRELGESEEDGVTHIMERSLRIRAKIFSFRCHCLNHLLLYQ